VVRCDTRMVVMAMRVCVCFVPAVLPVGALLSRFYYEPT
jgi:hypothetical protein